MFLDEAKINVKSGNGGNGMTAFFNLRGGRKKVPSGGSGGKGGDVIIRACPEISTLYGFKKKVHFKAEDGKSGQANNRKGEEGSDLIIKVPGGTVLMDNKGEMIADLDMAGKEIIIARGGIGGRGNASFVSGARRFPAFAEIGEKTDEFWINLELRLAADASLVGFPNCGKSTIISRISAARPKIADYPFTTLTPNLGVVAVDGESFVVADIPGLIQGAHKGSGLGDKFLKHVTRSAILAIVLDGERIINRREDIVETFNILREEIRLYDRNLFKKDYIVLINKVDLINDSDKLNKIKKILEHKSRRSVFPVSAVTGEGLGRMIWGLYGKVRAFREASGRAGEADSEKRNRTRIYSTVRKSNAAGKIEIEKNGDEYVIRNKKLERMVAMTDIDNEEALDYLMHALKRTGIADRLKEKGIKQGSTIVIGQLVFALSD